MCVSVFQVSWPPFIEFVTCIQKLSLIYRVRDAHTEFVWHNTEIVKHMQRVLSVRDACTEFVTHIQSSWLIYRDLEAYAEGTFVNGISVISHELYELRVTFVTHAVRELIRNSCGSWLITRTGVKTRKQERSRYLLHVQSLWFVTHIVHVTYTESVIRDRYSSWRIYRVRDSGLI